MPLAKLRAKWPILAVILCAAMVAVLAALQIAWTDQLSLAQEAMMQNALSNSIRQFEQAIQRELAYLLFLFQPRVRGGRQERWNQYAEDYALWSETTAHPAMLRRMLFYALDSDGSRILLELPLGGTEPVPADWSEEFVRLRASLDATGDRAGRTRDLRPFAWTVFPAARAVARPEPSFGGIRRGPDRAQRRIAGGNVILILDWAYITETFLPVTIRRLFAGPDGEQLYEVAIATRGDPGILFRSDSSIGPDWLAAADSRRRFRLLREPQAPGPGPGPGPQAEGRRRPGPGSGANERPRGPAGGSGIVRRAAGSSRSRIYIAGGDALPPLMIAATHTSGSLEGAVERQRARSLATGLGVLLVLAGAMALVVVGARRAEQLAGMQMEFIAGVTHELRTPLSVIRSVGENLADGVTSGAEQVRRYGELIRDQGDRLSRMVEQTLQFAALESGKRQFHIVWLDAGSAVNKALEQAGPMIEQAGFALERSEDRRLPRARGDEEAVQQILANLLSNAVKYGEPGRWVRVEAGADDDGSSAEVQIRVHDRGKGILASEGRRIFDAYYRGSAAGEENIQGSGLGLKLARDLALGMGGNLSFRSDPGKGSVFTLHLPTQAESEA